MRNKKTIYQKCSLIQNEIFYKSLNKQLFRMTYKMVRAELKFFFLFHFQWDKSTNECGHPRYDDMRFYCIEITKIHIHVLFTFHCNDSSNLLT